MTRSIALALIAALAACGSTSTPAAKPSEPASAASPSPAKLAPSAANAALLANEQTAWNTARPVFEKNCATCHTKAGKQTAKKKLDHFDMDTYPPGGHHTGTIGYKIREVLGLSGEKATMPFDKPGSVEGDDLATIKAWTDAWEAADKAGAHPPAAPDKDDD